MKASNFVLKHKAEDRPVADIFRKAEIWETLFFKWKKNKYDGLLPDEMWSPKLLIGAQ